MTDIVFTSVNLPPAFLGQVYECAIAYKGNTSSFVSQAVATSINGSGLPAGLALDAVSSPGSLRITGTPTGAASTAASSGTSLAGPGAYTFALTVQDGAGAVSSSNYTINLYSAPDDPNYLEGLSVTAQAALRVATDQ
jgi:hypothetical protein